MITEYIIVKSIIIPNQTFTFRTNNWVVGQKWGYHTRLQISR